ncbi:Flp pilus assembly protein CpaB [Bdellovibrionota bacterium FG-2]
MNSKVLTLSLVMAVLAVFFVSSYVGSMEEETKKKFGTEVLVLTAKRDVKEMETLNETAFELKSIPKTFLEPASVFYEKKDKDDKEVTKSIKSLSGAVAVVPIKKGEQITFNKFTEPSIRTGLAPQITPGRRAVSVPVNETSGVSKLIKPGDRVDLLAVIDTGGGKQSKVAKTILQDVVVLSVGRNVTNNVPRLVEVDTQSGKEKIRSLTEDSNFASVTLEVEPMQAQALALVMASGDSALSLSLRNNDDSERTNLSPTGFNDIMGGDMSRGLAGKR